MNLHERVIKHIEAHRIARNAHEYAKDAHFDAADQLRKGLATGDNTDDADAATQTASNCTANTHDVDGSTTCQDADEWAVTANALSEEACLHTGTDAEPVTEEEDDETDMAGANVHVEAGNAHIWAALAHRDAMREAALNWWRAAEAPSEEDFEALVEALLGE